MRRIIKLSVAITILLVASTALAIPIDGLLTTGVPTLLSDNSAEYLINADGSTTDTFLDVGDRLRGIFTIGTIESDAVGSKTIGEGTVYSELTGFFDIEVAAKTDLGGTAGFTFVFAPYAGFATEVEGMLGYTAGDLTNSMVTVFQDSTPNYSRITDGNLDTTEELIGTATDGDHMWSFGFDGTLGEGWSAYAFSDNIGDFTAPGASNSGLFNYGLNLIYNNTVMEFGDVQTTFGGFADLSGSGSLISPRSFDTPFDVFDNLDMTINVPEPGTLLLLLTGLGFCAFRNRKKKLL